jgi:hypothetical protein
MGIISYLVALVYKYRFLIVSIVGLEGCEPSHSIDSSTAFKTLDLRTKEKLREEAKNKYIVCT